MTTNKNAIWTRVGVCWWQLILCDIFIRSSSIRLVLSSIHQTTTATGKFFLDRLMFKNKYRGRTRLRACDEMVDRYRTMRRIRPCIQQHREEKSAEERLELPHLK